MVSKQRRTNVSPTSWRRIDIGTTLLLDCVPAGCFDLETNTSD